MLVRKVINTFYAVSVPRLKALKHNNIDKTITYMPRCLLSRRLHETPPNLSYRLRIENKLER